MNAQSHKYFDVGRTHAVEKLRAVSISLVLMALLVAMAAVATAQGTQHAKPLAEVNGQPITEEEIDKAIAGQLGKLNEQIYNLRQQRLEAVIRDRYDAPRNLEQQRPAVVAGRLYARALDAAGLTSGRKLQGSIERLARNARVKTTATEIRVDPGDLIDAAGALSPQAEVECFATVLAGIEDDLPSIAERARAWALGDIAALRRFDYPDIEGECLSFAATSAGLSETLLKAESAWLDAAERALAANETTFATLGVGDLLRADGPLARLRERGYEVREP